MSIIDGQGGGDSARLTGKKMQTASCCNHPAHSLDNECLLKVKGQDISRLSTVFLFSVLLTSVGACYLQGGIRDPGSYAGQVRTLFLHHSEARGPCYARARIQQELFQAESVGTAAVLASRGSQM